MEGGLLVHAAYALVLIWVWVWRRWFEEEGVREPEFERFCAERPLLAAFSVQPGREGAVVAALRAAVPNAETLPTLGGWPWIYYVLRVEVVAEAGVVRLFIAKCRRLRTRERRPVALTTALADVMHAHAADIRDSWLYSAARVDVSGRSNGEHGWRFAGGAANKPQFSAWERRPSWAQRERHVALAASDPELRVAS